MARMRTKAKDFFENTRFRSLIGALMGLVWYGYRPELHYMRGPGPACKAKHSSS